MIYVNVIDPYIFMANSNIEMKSILYTIYPNPSNGDFNLNMSGLDYGLVKVSISNITQVDMLSS